MSRASTAAAVTAQKSVMPVDRDAAIEQYAPLVKYVVGRLAIGLPAILDYEDILSYGTIGLIEALDRFDGSKGVKFETYAISRIRGSIIDALRVARPAASLGAPEGEEAGAGDDRTHGRRSGASLSETEIAAAMGMTHDAVQQDACRQQLGDGVARRPAEPRRDNDFGRRSCRRTRRKTTSRRGWRSASCWSPDRRGEAASRSGNG